MTVLSFSHRVVDSFDIHEVDNGERSADRQYAVVALCRDAQNLPAIGGTRAVVGDVHTLGVMAIDLAKTMDDKVRLVRLADRQRHRAGRSRFEWRGGKGIILLPRGQRFPSTRSLLAYGRLVEHLGGEFFASIDANVGRSELRWLEQATSYTVGNAAPRRTSEATAIGVRAGLHATLEALGLPAEHLRQPLGNVAVTLFGLGKVGFSLLGMLHDEGAEIRIWDPALRRGCDRHFEIIRDSGGQIDERDRDILRRLRSEQRIFSTEERALASAFASGSRPIRIVCAAADENRWLLNNVGRKPRYEHFASATHDGPMLIIGATNDQLGVRRDAAAKRALTVLSRRKIIFIPDPIVSPGGVISASWELAAAWDAHAVRRDTEEIVTTNVTAVIGDTRLQVTASRIDAAFQRRLSEARGL